MKWFNRTCINKKYVIQESSEEGDWAHTIEERRSQLQKFGIHFSCHDQLYNQTVFGPEKGICRNICKTDDKLLEDLISIHNAENWLWVEGDVQLSMFDKGNVGDEKADNANKILPMNGSLISNKERWGLVFCHSVYIITLFSISWCNRYLKKSCPLFWFKKYIWLNSPAEWLNLYFVLMGSRTF